MKTFTTFYGTQGLLGQIDVINALIESIMYGGLSEFHSNIQMTCAHDFLYLNKEFMSMVIKIEELPRELGSKVPPLGNECAIGGPLLLIPIIFFVGIVGYALGISA